MILYTPDPSMLLDDSVPRIRYGLQLESGGLINVEPCENNQLRIVEIISTDPMDYMDQNLQPGAVLPQSVSLKNLQNI